MQYNKQINKIQHTQHTSDYYFY